MKAWLFDTGVWLGSLRTKSAEAERILRNPSNRVLTSPLSIAEVASVIARRGHAREVRRVISEIREMSVVRSLDLVDYEAGGRIHAAERAHHRDFSLVDAMILAQARADNATVLTTDGRLAKNRQGVRVRVV